MSFVDKDSCLPGGETFRDVQERAVPVIKLLLRDYQGKRLAIGTHGTIKTAISTTMPDTYRLDFENGDLANVD